jgi:transcriptional regulator GlxA family with amidase domain
MNRREFVGAASAALAFPAIATQPRAGDAPRPTGQERFGPIHQGRRPEIGMLLYPGMTLMDLLGPQTVFAAAANVHLLWKTKDAIETDTGIVIRPSMTLADCPRELDVLFVGGGPGQLAVMKDADVVRFLADRGAAAKYVTSVCSGSLILGAAGLLRGYKATCHWAGRAALPLFGAVPVDVRVVVDRNRVTGGGVTAGLDFGLVLLSKMLGDEIAQMTQLALEYDPAPPFRCGTPKTAGPELTKKVSEWMGPLGTRMFQVCAEAAKAMHK